MEIYFVFLLALDKNFKIEVGLHCLSLTKSFELQLDVTHTHDYQDNVTIYRVSTFDDINGRL